MKKYPVLKRFRDKTTSKIYVPGDSYPTDDCDRASNLQRLGFIAADTAKEAPTDAASGATKAGKKLKDMNLTELGEVVAKEGVEIGGATTKADIRAKIEEARAAAGASAAPAAPGVPIEGTEPNEPATAAEASKEAE